MKEILIIENDEDVARMFAHFLESHGYACKVALGGQVGAELFEKRKFDLILADLLMPNGTGYELAERIRARDKVTPMLLMTGQTEDVLVTPHARHAGFNDVLFKPIPPDDLLGAVRAQIGEANG